MNAFEKTVRTAGVTLNIYTQEPASITLHFNDYHRSNGAMSLIVNLRDLPDALNIYRALGEAIDAIQPGIVNPVPDGHPDEVDAMKVIYEADSRRMTRF